MCKDRRVLIITRHFWPVTTDRTLRLLDWAQQLQQWGARPGVLTPRWHPSWPRQVMCGEIPVYRIDPGPSLALRTGKYIRMLSDWLARESSKYDLIYCDAPDIEASALLSQVSGVDDPPVVVRFDPLELSDKQLDQWQPSAKTAEVCRKASAVIAPTALAHKQLLAIGINRQAIIRLRHQPKPVDRSVDARRKARQVLASVNHDLFAKSTDRVVVCPGELDRQWGVDLLVRAMGPLVEKHRQLRLWILGDGPQRPRIYESLRHDGLHRLIAMPGIFTDYQEILQAADLCVFPAANKGLRWALPTCIASSIPVLVSSSEEARHLLGEQADQLTFLCGETQSLRDQMTEWLDRPPTLAGAMSELQNRLVADEGGAQAWRRFLGLLNEKCSH